MDSLADTRRRSARYYDYPAHHGADLVTDPTMEGYEKQPLILHRHPNHSREHAGALVVRSKPVLVRAASSDGEYERRPRRKSVVLRPRSTSRVRIQEPVLLATYSSSDDEPRRSRRSRRSRGDDTRIRATSRPGKKTEFALVRSPSKKRRKSRVRPVAVTDLELKTDRRHKDFQTRRNDLENTEALVLVRARSQERERFVDDLSELDSYDGRRRRSLYIDDTRRTHGSIDNGRRELVFDRHDRGRTDKRTNPKLYSYGNAVLVAGQDSAPPSYRHAPESRRLSISPDYASIASSTVHGSIRYASTPEIPRNTIPFLPRAYDDRAAAPQNPTSHYAASTTSDSITRRANDREREAIEREKRAIEREKAALDREKLLVEREKPGVGGGGAGDLPPELRGGRGVFDYLEKGPTYLKDGQKYYKDGQKYLKGGQGLVGGVKNIWK
jgi:hypothetical protein